MSGTRQFCINQIRRDGGRQLLKGFGLLVAAVLFKLLAGDFTFVEGVTTRAQARPYLRLIALALVLGVIGIILLIIGVKRLLLPNSKALTSSIRAQLAPEAGGDSWKELFARVDADLSAGCQSLAGGRLFVGREWMLLDDPNPAALRTERLCGLTTDRVGKKPALVFVDRQGGLTRLTNIRGKALEEIRAHLHTQLPQLMEWATLDDCRNWFAAQSRA